MPNQKRFRLFDAVLAAVCIVLVVESAAPAAAIGNSQFFWWIFLLIGFFLPYGQISAELGTTYEDEGGIYDWVRRAFGESWGCRVAWYYYINFPLWMGSLAVLFTDVLAQIFGWNLDGTQTVMLQLAFIWIVVFVSNFRISESKWILNLAALFKAAIMISIGALGIYAAVTRGPANVFTPRSLLPSLNVESLSNLSVILFNFLGFEVVTTFASEMQNPGKEIPKAIVLGGILIAIFYLLAAFGISVAIPTENLSASSGLIESFMLLTGRTGGPLIILFGLLFCYTLMANLISWSLGVNYVAQYAARQKSLPGVFGISSKEGMPLGANLLNGLIASVMVLLAPAIPSPDLFWSFFALNMIMLLLSYILIFPAFRKLRQIDPDLPRPYRVNGGPVRLALMTYVPLVLLILSVIFSIVPLNTTPEELSGKLPILIGTVAAVLIGEAFVGRAAAQRKNSRKEVDEP